MLKIFECDALSRKFQPICQILVFIYSFAMLCNTTALAEGDKIKKNKLLNNFL
jgi:hypothetical protein